MSRISLNIIVGLILGICSLLLIFISKNYPGTSKNFPITMLIFIGILSIAQIIISIYRYKNLNQKNFEINKISLIIFCLSFLTIYLMQFLNFFGAFLIFFLSLIYFYKLKNIKNYLLGTIILFLAIFIIFEFGLNVSLINREFLG
jgi:hypothetical protein